jgi:predicted RNase H-like nuclease (RuvC/YqgF family)
MRHTGQIGVFFLLTALAAAPLGNSQSLAELARREAERRKALDLEGVKGKIIQDFDVRQRSGGNISTSSPSEDSRKTAEKQTAPKSGVSLKIYRAAIEKLDREIRQARKKLTAIRERLADLRWAPPRAGKSSASSTSDSSLERLSVQIQELEAKLKQLESERLQTYDEGRKAGYLPGELDGKGIMP